MTSYYTYRITCTHPASTEKYYYGFRKTNKSPLDDNYWSSSSYVKQAIQKYGLEHFNKKIIKVFDNPEDAISHENRLHEKMQVDQHPLFFNKCKSTKWGYRVTGLVLSGKTYEEIHGEQRAAELKAQRSRDMKAYRQKNPVNGSKNPNYGNKWSDEQKRVLSEKHQGEKHPTFGWFWITNGHVSKKVPPGSEIPVGFTRGRKRTWKNQYGK